MTSGNDLNPANGTRQERHYPMREGPVDVQEVNLPFLAEPPRRPGAGQDVGHRQKLEEGFFFQLIRCTLSVRKFFQRPRRIAKALDLDAVYEVIGQAGIRWS